MIDLHLKHAHIRSIAFWALDPGERVEDKSQNIRAEALLEVSM